MGLTELDLYIGAFAVAVVKESLISFRLDADHGRECVYYTKNKVWRTDQPSLRVWLNIDRRIEFERGV